MSTPQPAASASSNRKVIGAIIALVIVALFVFAYVTVLNSYNKQGEQTAALRDTGTKSPDHVEVIATVISADPIKAEMTVRVDLEPHGTLTEDEGFSPTENLSLLVNGATGKREHTFEKGKPISPVDVVVALAGQSSDYPFDKHEGQLFLSLIAHGKNKQAEPSDGSSENGAATTEKRSDSSAAEAELVPMAVDFTGSLHGLKIEATKDAKESGEGFITIDVGITRASTVKLLAVFVMVLFWGLSLAALAIVLLFWLKRRNDLNTLPFHVGLLLLSLRCATVSPTYRRLEPTATTWPSSGLK